MTAPILVSSYTVSPAHANWDPALEAELLPALCALPGVAGLEVPWAGRIHPHDEAWFLANVPAVSLAGLESGLDLWTTLAILAVIALIMTGVVYGAVALLVKIDDIGLKMAKNSVQRVRHAGTRIVRSMPAVFRFISVLGTVAMLWVGGHLLLVNLGEVGLHVTTDMLHAIEGALEPLGGFVVWLVETIISAIVGLIVGLVIVGIVLGIARMLGKSPSFHEGEESPAHVRI